MPEIEVGYVSDFFSKPSVAGITLTLPLKVGDKVHIKGHTRDLECTVDSMQINNANVTKGIAGNGVGIIVPDRVRPGDKVYVVTDECSEPNLQIGY